MNLPLSKYDKELLNEIEQVLNDGKTHDFSLEDYAKYKDWFLILKDRGYIWDTRADGAYLCGKNADFNDFNKWLNNEDAKAKKLKRREWYIAIVSAIIGATISALTQLLFN